MNKNEIVIGSVVKATDPIFDKTIKEFRIKRGKIYEITKLSPARFIDEVGDEMIMPDDGFELIAQPVLEDNKVGIPRSLFKKLDGLGMLPTPSRGFNIGKSDYATRGNLIQPWSVWIDWKLDPWDADIVKRVFRRKEGTPRVEDYEKIIHICHEKIRQENEK